ncbi:MAG: hypothetical protein ACNA8O_10180 [Cyanobacteriota bacterium]|jgi:hypothetical protein
MASLSLLTDHAAETINGGWSNGGWFNSLKYTSFSMKSVVNNVSQSNAATNVTSGFGGISLITNEQLNLASITSVIG